VKSRATPRFWTEYHELPVEIRELARKTYALFRNNPAHPSLNFKRVHSYEPVYSVRVARGYRALGLLEGGEITWFWIGTHAGYDRLLTGL
jgi:hypothetical protein